MLWIRRPEKRRVRHSRFMLCKMNRSLYTQDEKMARFRPQNVYTEPLQIIAKKDVKIRRDIDLKHKGKVRQQG